MEAQDQDTRELLQMAALLKGAASRAVFRDCAAIFTGVAELLERRAMAINSGAPLPTPPPPATTPRRPLNITA